MKKLTITFALILCFVFVIFAFASCGKDKKPVATTAATTAGPVGCVHVWGDFEIDRAATCTAAGSKSKYCTKCGEQDPDSITEIPMIDHTPAEDYTIDVEPTCSVKGSKSKHCTVCNSIVETTKEDINIDPNAHNIETWNVTKQATLFADGERNGDCTLCKKNIKEDYTSIVEQKYTTEALEKRLFVEQNIYTELLNKGEKHFYPDTTNGGTGLDLYVEYSFLWNNTFENLGDNSTSGGHPVIDTRLCSEANDKGKGNDLTWMALKNNASGSDCKFAGGFEYGSLRTVEIGPEKMSERKTGVGQDGKPTYAAGTTYADFPNIGGDDKNNPEWGWHRVGVRFHQELTNAAELMADTEAGKTEATYYLYVETYVDGVRVSKLSNKKSDDYSASTSLNDDKGNNLLFTAESDGEGGITYKDVAEGVYVNGMRLPFTKTVKDTAYVVYADYYATAGTGFVQNVTRVANPAAQDYVTSDGALIPAPIYYTINP